MGTSLEPICLVDGALVRLTSKDGITSVEMWSPIERDWVPGGADVSEVLKGPLASPQTIAEYMGCRVEPEPHISPA